LLLNWEPLVRLSAGAYEAWVSPGAGGRLCRLVWHGPSGDLDLVIPVNTEAPFEEDHWPKQGAFPMLPYANRLKGANVWWEGKTHRVRAAVGQTHGLHGVGHRRSWLTDESHPGSVRLRWQHTADGVEWPWSFTAVLDHALTPDGLHMALAIRNDSTTAMPAVLGWHPYVPLHWRQAHPVDAAASALLVLDSDGSCHPPSRERVPRARQILADMRSPHTLALQDWNSTWSMQAASGERWCLRSDAPHLVHHVPGDQSHVCIEPVTALPGALGAGAGLRCQQETELMPGTWRHLNCRLGVEV
jgi:aldose 1-epimerase